MAALLLRAGHLAAEPKLTLNYGLRLDVINPQTVNEAGQRRLARTSTRAADPGRRRGRHGPGRQRREHAQLGAAPRHHLSDQRQDRGPRRLRPELRHRHLRLDLRPRRDPEPARALDPGDERARQLRVRLQPRAGPAARRSSSTAPTGRFPLPDGVTALPADEQDAPAADLDAWNITVQRQLSTDTSVELAYVGNHGSQYMAEDGPDENLNQASIVGYPNVPLNDRRPFFNQFGWTQGFRAFMNDASNHYNSIQTKFVKSMTKGWSLLAHYTFAKANQHADDYFWIDRELNWGTPGWHRTHQVVLAGSYELPFAKESFLLGGWQLNANVFIASGQPFGIDYRDAGQDRDTGPNRPDVIGDPRHRQRRRAYRPVLQCDAHRHRRQRVRTPRRRDLRQPGAQRLHGAGLVERRRVAVQALRIRTASARAALRGPERVQPRQPRQPRRRHRRPGEPTTPTPA